MLYFPSLKTTDSELRAIQHLSPDIKANISPIFELTRSRKTKKEPSGSLLKRVKQLREVYGDGNAIIDLTTEDDFMNPEMETLFDEREGYGAWCGFTETNLPIQYSPCVQFIEGGTEQNFVLQAQRLVRRFGKVALRLSVQDLEAEYLYNWLVESIGTDHIIVIANSYFIEQGMLNYYEELCATFLAKVIGNRLPKTICFPSSSFPRAVGSGDYGEDDEGTFTAMEILLFNRLKVRFPSAPLAYSDYASVHPIRYPTGFGTWIPRIDIPFDGSFSYTRIRRDEGGYVAAANKAMSKYGKNLVDCWGSDQIRSAAQGKLPGGNPSFWISARINQWITQRARSLAAA